MADFSKKEEREVIDIMLACGVRHPLPILVDALAEKLRAAESELASMRAVVRRFRDSVRFVRTRPEKEALAAEAETLLGIDAKTTAVELTRTPPEKQKEPQVMTSPDGSGDAATREDAADESSDSDVVSSPQPSGASPSCPAGDLCGFRAALASAVRELDEEREKVGLLMQPVPGAAGDFPWQMMRLWVANYANEKQSGRQGAHGPDAEPSAPPKDEEPLRFGPRNYDEALVYLEEQSKVDAEIIEFIKARATRAEAERDAAHVLLGKAVIERDEALRRAEQCGKNFAETVELNVKLRRERDAARSELAKLREQFARLGEEWDRLATAGDPQIGDRTMAAFARDRVRGELAAAELDAAEIAAK